MLPLPSFRFGQPGHSSDLLILQSSQGRGALWLDSLVMGSDAGLKCLGHLQGQGNPAPVQLTEATLFPPSPHPPTGLPPVAPTCLVLSYCFQSAWQRGRSLARL